jgi:putative DNA primase/helicase
MLQHCRAEGIKDARVLIDAVLKAKPVKPSSKAASAATVVLADDDPTPEPVDGAALLHETSAAILRYVVMTRSAAELCSLWVGAAFALDALNLMPMLLFTSPEPACGKTTAATLISALTPRPVMVSSLTPAVLFRLIDAYHPTLIADECDSWLTDEKSELRGVFNCAHWRAGAVIPRCVGDDHEIHLFNVFGPKVIAMIGKPVASMLSRCIVITLRRKLAGDPVERLRDERAREDYADLRRRWRRWTLDHLDALRRHEPQWPDGPENRAADNLRPLLSVADLAGGDWPERARRAAQELLTGHATEDESITVALLSDVREVFTTDRQEHLSSEMLIASLKRLPDRPWADWNRGAGMSPAQLARHLRAFGSKPGGLRTQMTWLADENRSARRWHKADFEDAWSRYLPALVENQASNPQGPKDSNGANDLASDRNPKGAANLTGSQNAVSSMNSGSLTGLTGSAPDPEASREFPTAPAGPRERIRL